MFTCNILGINDEVNYNFLRRFDNNQKLCTIKNYPKSYFPKINTKPQKHVHSNSKKYIYQKITFINYASRLKLSEKL